VLNCKKTADACYPASIL